MKPSVVRMLLLAAGILSTSAPAFSHHSNALVNKDQLYTVAGDVTRFAFVNPHVAIYWKGQDKNGKMIEWYASSAPPRINARRSWPRMANRQV